MTKDEITFPLGSEVFIRTFETEADENGNEWQVHQVGDLKEVTDTHVVLTETYGSVFMNGVDVGSANQPEARIPIASIEYARLAFKEFSEYTAQIRRPLYH